MASDKDWRAFKQTCWALVAIGVFFLTLQKACAQSPVRSDINVKTGSFAILEFDVPTHVIAFKPLDLDFAQIDTAKVPQLLYWTGKRLQWKDLPENKHICLVPTPPKPTTLVLDSMSGTVGTDSWRYVRHIITVSDGGDDEQPDDPPDDEDEEDDQDDDANPVPAPDGLRVLVVYETEDENRALASITAQRKVRDWLNQNCVKNGQQPEYRFFDQHAQFPSGMDSLFARWMQRPRDSLPWIVIANGKKSFEGPFPHSADALISLLEQYK